MNGFDSKKAILITATDSGATRTTDQDVEKLKNLIDRITPEAAKKIYAAFDVTLLEDTDDLFFKEECNHQFGVCEPPYDEQDFLEINHETASDMAKVKCVICGEKFDLDTGLPHTWLSGWNDFQLGCREILDTFFPDEKYEDVVKVLPPDIFELIFGEKMNTEQTTLCDIKKKFQEVKEKYKK